MQPDSSQGSTPDPSLSADSLLDLGLTDRVAVVTGGSRNIGSATALCLAAAGVRVGIVAQSESDELRSTVEECARLSSAHAAVGDLADPVSVATMADDLESELGPVDILINNAGIRPRTKLSDITIAEWDWVHSVNLRAPFQLIQRFLPGMQERRWGRVLNVSGQDALMGSVHRVHVTASKGGLIGLTASLTAQVAKYGVTVNTVVPGAIDTKRHSPDWYPQLLDMYALIKERTPTARFGSPMEVARTMLFLSSDWASYITGQTISITGGYPVLRRRDLEDDSAEDWCGPKGEWDTQLRAAQA